MRLQTIWTLNWDRDKTKGFVSVGAETGKFLPKSEAAGDFNSPPQHAVASPFRLLLPLCWGIKFVQEVRFHDSITIRK